MSGLFGGNSQDDAYEAQLDAIREQFAGQKDLNKQQYDFEWKVLGKTQQFDKGQLRRNYRQQRKTNAQLQGFNRQNTFDDYRYGKDLNNQGYGFQRGLNEQQYGMDWERSNQSFGHNYLLNDQSYRNQMEMKDADFRQGSALSWQNYRQAYDLAMMQQGMEQILQEDRIKLQGAEQRRSMDFGQDLSRREARRVKNVFKSF